MPYAQGVLRGVRVSLEEYRIAPPMIEEGTKIARRLSSASCSTADSMDYPPVLLTSSCTRLRVSLLKVAQESAFAEPRRALENASYAEALSRRLGSIYAFHESICLLIVVELDDNIP